MRLEELRRLIRLVEESDIAELDMWRWWGRIRIRKPGAESASGSPVVLSQGAAPPAPQAPVPEAALPPQETAGETPTAEDHAGLTPIKSPMVGTYYRAPAPDAEPYVEVGKTVEPGQTVCIIEAMKLMNEIQSEVRGKVTKMLVQNGEPVEFGQTLFLVDES
jgi:oxaloacetate decarboxylase alpha subunit